MRTGKNAVKGIKEEPGEMWLNLSPGEKGAVYRGAQGTEFAFRQI